MLLRSIFVVLLLLEFFHDLESLVQFFESLDKCKWLRRIKLDKNIIRCLCGGRKVVTYLVVLDSVSLFCVL